MFSTNYTGKGVESMKKLLGVALTATLMLGSANVAEAKESPKSVKKLAVKGKLPKTNGAIGTTHQALKKQVKGGKLYDSEMGTYYASKHATTMYFFNRYTKSDVTSKTKVTAIDRTFKQTSFTKKLTPTVMYQTFGQSTSIGGQFYDSYIYRDAYKAGKYYLMHKSRANNTVTLSVGKKSMLENTLLWAND